MEKPKKTESPLRHLHGDEWVTEDINRFFIRYYTVPFIDMNKISLPMNPGEEIVFMGVPYRMVFASIKDQPYTSSKMWPIRGEEGNLDFLCEEIKRILPPSNYLLISTPILELGDKGYDDCIVRIDQFVGVLRAVCGNCLFREIARESSVDFKNGKMDTTSPVLRMPKKSEGTKITDIHWEKIRNLLKLIEQAEDNLKNRLTLATQLFEQAARGESPVNFFLYWVSIEVLCFPSKKSKSAKIKKILSKSYNKKTDFIRNDLGVERLINLRNDVFHKGKEVNLSVDAERYIQAVFWDLLNAVLGQDCEHNIENYISSGFDLAILGKGGEAGILATLRFDKNTKKLDLTE